MSEKATGWTSATRCACVAGQSAAACALSTASSAFACAGVTPGFIRAQIVIADARARLHRRFVDLQRLPDLVDRREPERRRHHAHDGRRHVADEDLRAEEAGIRRESLAPDPLADHDDRRRRRARVGVGQRAPEDRRDARHRERRRGHFGDRDRLDDAVAHQEVARHAAAGGDVGERARAAAPAQEVRDDARFGRVGRAIVVLDDDDLIAVGQRQARPEHQRDEREHRDADGNRQRERAAADERQHRVAHEHAHPELEIEPGQSQPGKPNALAQQHQRHIGRLERRQQRGDDGAAPGDPRPVRFFQIADQDVGFVGAARRRRRAVAQRGALISSLLASSRGSLSSSRARPRRLPGWASRDGAVCRRVPAARLRARS